MVSGPEVVGDGVVLVLVAGDAVVGAAVVLQQSKAALTTRRVFCVGKSPKRWVGTITNLFRVVDSVRTVNIQSARRHAA